MRPDSAAASPRRPWWARLGLTLVLVIVVGLAVWAARQQRAGATIAVACPDPVAGCSFSHRGAPMQLRFLSPPTPLAPFELRLSGGAPVAVHAAFQMQGMDMGFNRYSFQPAADASMAATVRLPVCVSGRHDWILYLDIDGAIYALPFRTH